MISVRCRSRFSPVVLVNLTSVDHSDCFQGHSPPAINSSVSSKVRVSDRKWFVHARRHLKVLLSPFDDLVLEASTGMSHRIKVLAVESYR